MPNSVRQASEGSNSGLSQPAEAGESNNGQTRGGRGPCCTPPKVLGRAADLAELESFQMVLAAWSADSVLRTTTIAADVPVWRFQVMMGVVSRQSQARYGVIEYW